MIVAQVNEVVIAEVMHVTSATAPGAFFVLPSNAYIIDIDVVKLAVFGAGLTNLTLGTADNPDWLLSDGEHGLRSGPVGVTHVLNSRIGINFEETAVELFISHDGSPDVGEAYLVVFYAFANEGDVVAGGIADDLVVRTASVEIDYATETKRVLTLPAMAYVRTLEFLKKVAFTTDLTSLTVGTVVDNDFFVTDAEHGLRANDAPSRVLVRSDGVMDMSSEVGVYVYASQSGYDEGLAVVVASYVILER